MQGYPKSLNSWDDVLYVTENFSKDEWLSDVSKLIEADQVTIWEWDHVLDDGEAGLEDATHKVVDMNEDGQQGTNEDGTPKAQKVQYVLKPNLTCNLAKFKFCQTSEELDKAIAEVKAIIAGTQATLVKQTSKKSKK